MNIKVNSDNTLFWQLEDEYLRRKDELEELCEKADDLKKALDTGVNSVRIRTDDGDIYVGYKENDGVYSLGCQFEADRISSIGVEFVELAEDDDGYTIAIYRLEEDDE